MEPKSTNDLKRELGTLKDAMQDSEARMISNNHLKKKVLSSEERKDTDDDEKSTAMHGLALRIPAEIIAGSAVGYFIGSGLDKILETDKVFTMIFLLLGNLGAFLNIIRTISKK